MTKKNQKRSRGPRSGGLNYFMMHAVPMKGSKSQKHGGAYVSCWVNFPHGEGALVLAKHYIRSAGWRFRRLQEHKWLTRSDHRGRKSLQYYDEAAKDGSSFVFDLYPKSEKKRSNKRVHAASKTRRHDP